MRLRGRSLLVLAVLAVAAPAAAQAAPAPEVVARVDQSPIAKVAFDHWMVVAAADARPRRPAVPAAGTKAWKTLRTQVMTFLIDSRWIQQEALRREIAVAPATVHRQFVKSRRQAFPRRRDFRHFLRISHMTIADLTYRVKLDMLSSRIRAQAVRGVTGTTARQKALAAAVADMDSRWRSLTTCEDAYRVSLCASASAG